MTISSSNQKTPPDPKTFVEKSTEHIILWPAEARVAVIGGQWRRLPDGRIEAVYTDKSELALCLTLSQWIKEWDAEPTAEKIQGELIPRSHHYYQEA